MKIRRMLLTVAAAVGVATGALVLPAPALAMPSGGWCYSDWYEHSTDYGVSQQPYISRFFQNNTAVPVHWTDSVSVTHTWQSTYTTTTTFSGGFNFGIVKAETQSVTTVTTVQTLTVNESTGFAVDVPPFTTYYADYGPQVQQTSGTYYQYKYGCDYGDFPSTTSGSVTTAGLTGAEGWVIHT